MTTDGCYFTSSIDLAGIPICLHMQYEEAVSYFTSYGNKYPAGHMGVSTHVSLTEDDWENLVKKGLRRCGQIEASYLSARCSDALLKYRRCLVHAAAFRDESRSWLIAAGSGVGKSTQMATLEKLYPGRYSVICGDRPVLEVQGGGEIIVHPSPWNGKEGWGGAAAVPLSGIIFLRRGDRNQIHPMTKKEAVLRLYEAVIQTAETSEGIISAASCMDAILTRTKVWEFINEDVPKSTELLYETVLSV